VRRSKRIQLHNNSRKRRKRKLSHLLSCSYRMSYPSWYIWSSFRKHQRRYKTLHRESYSPSRESSYQACFMFI